jgi:predicted cupin superfamily sugar epimerase
MNETAKAFVEQYSMQPHPEGGFYKETWRSKITINTEGMGGFSSRVNRNLFTSILFLLPGDTFSALHRIRSEELWNYHAGDPVVIYEIIDGQWKETLLGPGPGQSLQHVVMPGIWFASRCSNPEGFSLCGCVVSPGFNFEDFEMGSNKQLIHDFPDLERYINWLTRLP